MATSSILKTIVIDKKEDAEMLVNAFEEAEKMKTFYVVYYINGIATEKEMVAKSLDELLNVINGKIIGRLEYQIFSGKPFSHENLIYSHHK